MTEKILKEAYELGYTAGQMAGYAKALADIRGAK